MKILFVYYCFYPTIGGIENLMLGIGKELHRKGHEITVFTTNVIKDKSAVLKPEEKIQDIYIKRFNPLPFPNSAFVTPSMIPQLCSASFDLMHVFSYHPVFMTNASCLVSKLLKKPLVMTPIYNTIRTTLYQNFITRSYSEFFDEKIGPIILRRADYVTALTTSEADFYRTCGVKNIKVVPEGIDIPNPPPAAEIQKFREKYLLDGEVLLSVGRIIKYKGLDFLIKAFAYVLKRFPIAKLLIVGEDWGYLSSVKRIVSELKCDENVVFTGLLNNLELACAYEAADFVVHPSYFETFIRIALEAWAHRKPIVCFNLGGPTEFITPETGILVKYGDLHEMRDAITKLLSNQKLCKSMGENGYRLVSSKYSWDNIATELENIYQLACKA